MAHRLSWVPGPNRTRTDAAGTLEAQNTLVPSTTLVEVPNNDCEMSETAERWTSALRPGISDIF
jgi:hypothetical protein